MEISERLKSNVCISDAVLWMCFEGFWRRPRPVRRAVRKKTASTHLGRIEVTTSALRILTCLLGRGEWFRLTTKQYSVVLDLNKIDYMLIFQTL